MEGLVVLANEFYDREVKLLRGINRGEEKFSFRNIFSITERLQW
jgi:hypothetical protein